MSAPDTNVEKQEKRHKPALGGMIAGGVFVALLLIGFLFFVIGGGDAPVGADTQVDGRTGEVVPATE